MKMSKIHLRIVSLLLCLVMILGMAPAINLFAAAEATTSTAKGESCGQHGTHDGWTVLDSTTENVVAKLQAGGNYVLNGNVELAATVTVANNLHICLNGYSIYGTMSGNVFTVTNTSAAVTFTLCDCSSNAPGKVDASQKTGGDTIVSVRDNATFNLYGGKLTGKTGGSGGVAVRLERATATFNMRGGSISGNTYTGTSTAAGAKAVYLTAGATFNMSAGSISGNTSPNKDGIPSIFVRNGGTVAFSGTAVFNDGAIGQTGTPAATIRIRSLENGGTITTTTQITDLDSSVTEVSAGGVYTYSHAASVSNVATVGDAGFKTLEEAFANADGQIVQLQANVTLEEPIDVMGKVVLDLNSWIITAKKGAFTVSGTNELFINDGSVYKEGQIKAHAEAEAMAAIQIGATGSGGKVTLNEGKITGFTYSAGAGVRVHGNNSEFVMTGGEISGNTATAKGAGVYAYRGNVTMSGGKITDNKKGTDDQDIYVESGKQLTISGSSEIGMAVLVSGAVGKILTLTEGASIVSSLEMDVSEAVNCQSVANDSNWQYAFCESTVTGWTEIPAGAVITELKEGKYTLGGNVTVAPNLVITEEVQLNLNGYTISGTVAPYFTVNNGGKLTITDIGDGKIDGSALTDSTGSGLVNVGADGTVILEAGTITGHTTTGMGGGVRLASATAVFTMKGGKISGNTSKNGGGVYISKGTFNMEDGEISGNTASISTGGRDAGGIYLGEGTFTITGGKISNNTGNNGGAFYVVGGTLNIAGGEISGNTANADGSVVYSNGCTINVTGGMITGNVAASGSIFNISASTFTMSSGTIKNNSKADGSAARVYFGNYVAASTATFSGDAIVEDVVVLAPVRDAGKDTEVPVPTVKVGELTEGARILAESALVVEGSNVVTNSVSTGLEYVYGTSVSGDDIIINSSTVSTLPEGSYVLGCDISLTETIAISGNVVLDLNGHTITGAKAPYFTVKNGTLTINDANGTGKIDGSVLQGSTASGLISVEGNGIFNLNGGKITGHTTNAAGAAVRVDGSPNAVFNMTGGEISGNHSIKDASKGTYSMGGAVYVYRGVFNMSGGLITGNTGDGAVCLSSNVPTAQNPDKIGVLNMTGGTIEGNTCGTSGEVHIRTSYSGIINLSGSAVIGGVGIKCGANIGELEPGASILSTTALPFSGEHVLEESVTIENANFWRYTYTATIAEDVAEVDGVKYKNLEAAIKAANGKTILLLADINVGGGIALAADSSVKLDLNGKTISGTSAPYFTVINSTLTITDSASGGKVDGSCLENSTASGLISVGNNGVFNLEGGKITGHTTTAAGGAVRVDGSTTTTVFNMSGGEISGNSCIKDAVKGTYNMGAAVFLYRGVFNMSGGIITDNAGVGAVCVTSNAPKADGPDRIGTFNMSGGKIEGNTCINSGEVHIRDTYAGNINLSGSAVIGGAGIQCDATIGNLTEGANIRSLAKLTLKDYYLRENLVNVDGKDYLVYTYSNTEMPDAAKVGSTSYKTLNEAIEAANGKTITLLSDVNVGKGIVLAAGTSITLDLNGNTISGTAAPFFTVNNSTLTIFDGKSGGKLDGSSVQGSSNSLVFVGENATFNLKSGTICGLTTKGSGAGVRIDHPTAVFNMSGGAITDNHTTNYGGGVFVYRGTFNMSGGIITGNTGVGGGVNISSNAKAEENPTEIGVFNMSGGTVTDNTCTFSGEVYIRKYYSGVINISGSAVIGGTGLWSFATIGNLSNGASILSNTALKMKDDRIIRESVTMPNGKAGHLYTFDPIEYQRWDLLEETFENFTVGTDAFYDAVMSSSNKTAYPFWKNTIKNYRGDSSTGKYAQYNIVGTSDNKYLEMKSINGQSALLYTKNKFSGAQSMQMDIRFLSGQQGTPVLSVNMFTDSSISGNVQAYIGPDTTHCRVSAPEGSAWLTNDDGTRFMMEYDKWYTLEVSCKLGEIKLSMWETGNEETKLSAAVNTEQLNAETMAEASGTRIYNIGKAERYSTVQIDNFKQFKKVVLEAQDFVTAIPGEVMTSVPAGDINSQFPTPKYKYELENKELGFTNRSGTLTAGLKSVEDTTLSTGTTKLKMTLLDLRGNETQLSYTVDMVVANNNGMSIGGDIKVKEGNIGSSKKLTASVNAAVAEAVPGYQIRWTSSDEKVVKVDATGKLTYIGIGTATIMATVQTADGADTRYFATTKVQVGPTLLRVLSLGSTLGRDSVMYLSQLAYAADIRIEVGALCNTTDSVRDLSYSLTYADTYYNWYTANLNNGELLLTEKNVSMNEKVESQKWDVIIINQETNAQGCRGNYNADLEYVLDYLEDVQPNAKIYWNVIWSMQPRFIGTAQNSPGFFFKYFYNSNPNVQYNAFYKQMDDYIIGTDALFSSSNANNLGATSQNSGIGWGIDGMIVNATTMQLLRQTLGHDRGLTSDGINLSFDAGRLAASMTVLKTIYDDLEAGGKGVKLDLASKISAAEVDKFINTTKVDYNYGKNSNAADNVIGIDESQYVYKSSDLAKIIAGVMEATGIEGIPAAESVPEMPRAEEQNLYDQVLSSIQVTAPLKLHFPDVHALDDGTIIAVVNESHHHTHIGYSDAGNNPYGACELGQGKYKMFESHDGGKTWDYDNPVMVVDELWSDAMGMSDVYNRYATIGAGNKESYTLYYGLGDLNMDKAYLDFDGDGKKEEVILMTMWGGRYSEKGVSTDGHMYLMTGRRNADGTYTWKQPQLIVGGTAKRGDLAVFSNGEILVPCYLPEVLSIRMKWDVRTGSWIQLATNPIPNLAADELGVFNETALVAPDPDSDIVYGHCRVNGQVIKSYDRGRTWELIGNEEGQVAQPSFVILDEERVFAYWASNTSPRTTYGKIFYVNGDWSDTRKEEVYSSGNTAAHDMGNPFATLLPDGTVLCCAYDTHYRSIVFCKVDLTEDKWLPMELSMRADTTIYESKDEVTLSGTDAIPADVKVFGSHTITTTVQFTKADGFVTISTTSGSITISAKDYELNKPVNIILKSMGKFSYLKVWQGDVKPDKWTTYFDEGVAVEKPAITGDGGVMKDVLISAKLYATMEEQVSAILGVSRVPIEYSVQPATVEVTFTSSNPEVATVDAKTGVVAPLKLGKTTITMNVGGLMEKTCEVTVNEPPTELTSKEPGTIIIWDDFEEDKYTVGKDVLWELFQADKTSGNYVLFKDGVGKDDELSGDVVYNIATDGAGNQYLEMNGGTAWMMSQQEIYGNFTVEFDCLFTRNKSFAITLWQEDLREGGSNEVYCFTSVGMKTMKINYRPQNLLGGASLQENPYRYTINVNERADSSTNYKTNGATNIWQSVKIVRVEGGVFMKVWNRDTEQEPENWQCIATHSVLDTDLATHFRLQYDAGEGDNAAYLDNLKITQQTHTVTYDVDGEKTQVQAPADKDLVAPEENPTKDGYKFVAWYEGDQEYVFIDNPVNREINLTAKWVEYKTTYIPVSGGKNSIQLKVVLEGNSVIIESFTSKDMAQLIGGELGMNEVVIDLTDVDIDVKSVVMPVKIMEQILSAAKKAGVDAEALVIKTKTGAVKFDHKAMLAVDEQTEGNNLRLGFEKVEIDNLTDAQKDAIKSKDVHGGITVTLQSVKTGNLISDFKGGKVTLEVPFEVPADYNASYFSMWYVSKDGKLEKQSTKYADGYLTWSVDHFSDYVVIYEQTFPWVIVVVGVLAVAGAAAAVVIIRKKKKKV